MQSQGKIVLKVYKTDITLALLAVLPAGISLGLDLLQSNDYFWFQRSGALMVLFGVLLDFNQNQYQKTQESTGVKINGIPAIIGSSMPLARKRIQVFSIALAVLGTFIWGYGDIPFKNA